jgi:hypothetical protein
MKIIPNGLKNSTKEDSMTKRISILQFSDERSEKDVDDLINPYSSCMRCGKTHNYTKSKNADYLNQLQLLAGKYELPFPTELNYIFKETRVETETKIKGIFNKREVTETKKFGTLSLILEFPKDLSDEDVEKWCLVTSGMFATLKALTRKD